MRTSMNQISIRFWAYTACKYQLKFANSTANSSWGFRIVMKVNKQYKNAARKWQVIRHIKQTLLVTPNNNTQHYPQKSRSLVLLYSASNTRSPSRSICAIMHSAPLGTRVSSICFALRRPQLQPKEEYKCKQRLTRFRTLPLNIEQICCVSQKRGSSSIGFTCLCFRFSSSTNGLFQRPVLWVEHFRHWSSAITQSEYNSCNSFPKRRYSHKTLKFVMILWTPILSQPLTPGSCFKPKCLLLSEIKRCIVSNIPSR